MLNARNDGVCIFLSSRLAFLDVAIEAHSWRHRAVFFHKNDTLKQAAIGRVALSFCQQWQREAIYRAMTRFIERSAKAYSAIT